MPPTLVTLCFLQISLCLIVMIHAHPGFVLMPNNQDHRVNQLNAGQVHKRAFDRLESSPFDFGGYSKRYAEEDPSFDFYRRKKAFDRLENSPFDFNFKRKRAFDRVDTSSFSFGMKKRSDNEQTHPSNKQHRLSIAELMGQVDQQQANEPSFLYFAP